MLRSARGFGDGRSRNVPRVSSHRWEQADRSPDICPFHAHQPGWDDEIDAGFVIEERFEP